MSAPEWNVALIVAAVVLTAGITLIFTLLGLRTGRRIERNNIEALQESDSRLIELSSADLQEKRKAYEDLLKAARTSVRIVVYREGIPPLLTLQRRLTMHEDTKEIHQDPRLEVLADAEKAKRNLQNVQFDLDLVASPEVLELTAALFNALNRCWSKLYEDLERRDPSPQGNEAQPPHVVYQNSPVYWKVLQLLVYVESRKQQVQDLFLELRDQIRKELGLETGLSGSASKVEESDVDFAFSDLTRANLSGVDLRGISLQGANLTSANLSNSDLSDVDLSRAILINANLMYADLSAAKMWAVDLASADLRGAQGLTLEQIEMAAGNSKTQLPTYLVRPERWRSV